MAYDIVIVNGSLVSSAETRRADVGIVDGQIAEIAPQLRREGAGRVLEAAGKFVMPGGIDVHTHLDMPLGAIRSADDFETGTRAAAFGGTTTIIDFATQSPGANALLLIKLAAVSDPDHDDLLEAIVDLIAYPPVADADSPDAFCASNLEASGRAGIGS